MPQATYEIRRRGASSPGLVGCLDGPACQETGTETVLLPLDIDEQDLHQRIARLRGLGIELERIRRTSPQAGPSQPADG